MAADAMRSSPSTAANNRRPGADAHEWYALPMKVNDTAICTAAALRVTTSNGASVERK